MWMKPWTERMNHFCPDLTNEEWDRFVEKNMKEALDLSFRTAKRQYLMKWEGKKRVPKHRYNKKNPLDP
jgi:hypothetical protein